MDPVYDEFILVERGSPVEKALKSSLLQRLRYIRQLGPCYLVYPGAEHTRFQHSLGVMWLVRKTLNFLKLKGFSPEPLTENALLLAGLLHDLGHSPFSHALEGVIVPESHEKITVEAFKLLAQEVGLERELTEEVLSIFTKSHSQPYTYQLISSQLDCDRLDYLKRDAFYTGVSFGRIEVNRILISAIVEGGELLWSYKGFNALESYVMSRYQMYWAVYFHKVNIAAQVLLEKIVKRMRELLLAGEKLCCDPQLARTLREGDTENLLRLTDGNVVVSIYNCQNSKDPILSDLSKRFIKRELFKTVEVKPSRLIELREAVERAGYNPEYYFEVVEPSKVAYSYYSPESEQLIKVKLEEGVAELSTVAPTDAVKALSRKVSKTYAVIPKELHPHSNAQPPSLQS